MTNDQTPPNGQPWTRWDSLICLALLGATTGLFWPVRHHEFITYDDPNYVTLNPRVQAGLTWENVVWAFQTASESNWHPLTWLSHILDCQLFGLNAGAHHLVNVFFHVLNSLLVFAVFRRLTGTRWPSAVVSALFALHPLHVESVAWVAERKDVLSAFFWMLTMWAYARYAKRPGLWWYSLTLVFFALGLMAKPMLVTLPFVLLLLDFWPLRRIRGERQSVRASKRQSVKATLPRPHSPGSTLHAPTLPAPRSPVHSPTLEPPGFRLLTSAATIQKVILEKIPFFILAAASSIVTYLAQQKGETVVALAAVPIAQRLANATISYVRYIGKMICPENLAVFYPYVRVWPAWQVAGAALVLIAVTWLAFWGRRNHRYLAVGWLWYLGTLFPVIGLVQVGAQSLADRYTYIPLIGLFVMLAWGAVDLTRRWHRKKIALALSASAAISGCLVVSLFQVRLWKDSVQLFEHALAATSSSATVHFNLGYALLAKGRIEDALVHFQAGLQRDPRAYWVYGDIGAILTSQGKANEAITNYQRGLQINPGHAEFHFQLASLLLSQKKASDAVVHYREALRLKPDLVPALNDLAWILATHEDQKLRNGAEAVGLAERACELTAHKEAFLMGTLAAAYAEAGRFGEAVSTAEKAAELATAAGQKETAATNRRLLELYRAGKPFRDVP